jgi:hypothetical protein
MGLLRRDQLIRLKEAGITRYHENIETSRRNFPNICTTHTYDDKIRVIRTAQEIGLSVCSGGIIGMGETWEDRIDMALSLAELGIRSIPINALMPIPGTPLEELPRLSEDEIRRTVAIFRFIVPEADIRLAAGRAFFRAVTGETFDEPAVRRALRDTDPLLRAADDRRDLVRWREEGVYTEGRGDEDYLKLQRKVLTPGRAAPEDVAVFASRLYLYPPYFCLPFAGVHDRCTFDEAIALAHRDAIVRYAALRKMMELSLFGGGRGERMTAAVDAYVAFLRALALGQATDAELTALLADADGKLKGVLEK